MSDPKSQPPELTKENVEVLWQELNQIRDALLDQLDEMKKQTALLKQITEPKKGSV